MSRRSVVVTTLTLLGLVLLQVTVVTFLPTPVAVPDLVIVAVLALAQAHGPIVGGLAGAWAGLLLDLVPPAAGPVGGWALVLGLVGIVVGRIAAAARPGPFAAMVLLAAGAALAVLGRAAVLWFAGAPVGWAVLGLAAASAGYALLLAPLALLVVTRADRRPSAALRTVPTEVAGP